MVITYCICEKDFLQDLAVDVSAYVITDHLLMVIVVIVLGHTQEASNTQHIFDSLRFISIFLSNNTVLYIVSYKVLSTLPLYIPQLTAKLATITIDV